MALIALGVTGGIGAYKAVEIVRGLQKRNHEVVAIMTEAAQRFVGPVTFEAITRRRVITDQFAAGANATIEHVALASSIDLLVVAPATADVIGKFAQGIADDALSSLHLATRAPVLMAPAMNTNMLQHAAVRHNMGVLAGRGVRFVEPGEGELACGWTGPGRLAEPEVVVAAADALVRPKGTLLGRCVVVTAGPTYEDIDPVRYVGNRSSGRMGFAIADAAAKRGARVVLVAGPTALAPPTGMELVRVREAAEMHAALMSQAEQADVIVMAAAVADYTLAGGRRGEKVSKDAETWTLRLTRTRDILKDLGAWRAGRGMPVLVGFAAETEDVVARARRKLEAKQADLVVANDVSRRDAGFEVDTNAVTLVDAAGDETLPVQPKTAIAGVILDRVERMLSERASRVGTG